MPETVRFAPSPTGEIHIGNVRTALYNWFLALRTGGRFVLRFDDTDAARSQERFARQIEADLAWLGIDPHSREHQSARLQRYDAAAAVLRDAGRLYPCYETPEELERKRARQRARGLPPVYDRAALELSSGERADLEAQGRRPHWRFKLPDGQRGWDDGCRGAQTVNLASLSDPVLIREDGTYLYTLPSVMDDGAMGITTVVRGEDHITNTGVQIALFEALGMAVPRFAHHNLLTRADGEPLSKRDNPLSVARLAASGYEPMAVASLAALTGTSHPVQPAASLTALAGTVALSDVSRGPATFDPGELDRLNAAIVHAMPYAAAEPRLATFGGDEPTFWETVRGNLHKVDDARPWVAMWREAPAAPKLQEADRPVVAAALSALPPEPWDETTFALWADAVKAATGAKGRALFMPLRRALTGEDHGPEMAAWIRLLGRAEVAARLEAALR